MLFTLKTPLKLTMKCTGSTDSNKAVNISLVTPGAAGLKTLDTFNPKLTYAIFGDEERIFGYQGLKINLRYNACDMRPSLQITYNKKFKTVGETSATDLKAVLENFLPKSKCIGYFIRYAETDQTVAAFEKSDLFESTITDPNYANFQPPGELWRTMEVGGQTYEIWKGSLADLAVQQVVKRIQILVPFFIEGGTFIELREPDWSLGRWTVFFLYQKKAVADPKVSPYTFMGYSTIYRYFYFTPLPSPPSSAEKKERISHPANLDFQLPLPEISLSDLRSRSRISQFVILPPFQGGGNGSLLYNAIFDFYLEDVNTVEITVEDPNESFDDMRDLNDLSRLRTIKEFSDLRINTDIHIRAKGTVPRDIVDLTELNKLRLRFKIAPRQFARLVEMQLLSLIPAGIRQSMIIERPSGTALDIKAKQHEYGLWQLYTKQRLYRHNKDALMQLDRTDRIDKLDEALGAVEADYARLLRALEQRDESKSSSNGKKRASPEDETADAGEPDSKKVKFA